MARAAVRYAQAVLDIANANNNASDVNRDMEQIAEIVKIRCEKFVYLEINLYFCRKILGLWNIQSCWRDKLLVVCEWIIHGGQRGRFLPTTRR